MFMEDLLYGFGFTTFFSKHVCDFKENLPSFWSYSTSNVKWKNENQGISLTPSFENSHDKVPRNYSEPYFLTEKLLSVIL